MNDDLFERGLKVRKQVLGDDYVDRSLQSADEFNMPFQRLVTEYAWGAVWSREGLPLKTRSLLNLAMLAALNRPEELKLHLTGALRNGVTESEIREVFLQVAIYAGAPAAMDAFRIARDMLRERAGEAEGP